MELNGACDEHLITCTNVYILYCCYLWKRISESAKAKSKCLLFASSYCAELEALCNGVFTEWNNAGDVAPLNYCCLFELNSKGKPIKKVRKNRTSISNSC